MSDLTALKTENQIFEVIANNSPDWWKDFKANNSLYIEIRKYNTINVYYQGGSVAK
ncbi:MAG: hypothetical protein LUC88_04120 [Prevotella sp.]|nr:hypothetical protein [Prevotella sp.]